MYAPTKGVVIYAQNNSSAGNTVVIDTGLKISEYSDFTICVVYMHLNSISVSVGEEVEPPKEGETPKEVGISGNTGDTGDPEKPYPHHLHYGIFLKNSNMQADYWNSYPLNPELFFTSVGYHPEQ